MPKKGLSCKLGYQDQKKSSNIIKQTLLNEKQDKDSGTMLDESQLIEE